VYFHLDIETGLVIAVAGLAIAAVLWAIGGFVFSLDGMQQELQDSKASWEAGWVHLFTNATIPTKTSVPGDFTEANWPGYAAAHPAFPNPPFVNGSNQAQIDSSPILFAYTGNTTGTFYGYYATNLGNTTLLFAENFPGPQSISNATTPAALTISIKEDALPNP